MCNFFYSLVSAIVHVTEVLLKLLTVILPFYPTLITPDESKEGRNRQGRRSPQRISCQLLRCGRCELQYNQVPSPHSHHGRCPSPGTTTLAEWCLRLRWMDRTTRRTRRPPGFEDFSALGALGCSGESRGLVQVRGFEQMPPAFSFQHTVPSIEGRSQKNGSPGSGGSMEAIARTGL